MTLAILVSAIQILWDDPNYLFLRLVATVAVVALAQSSPGWMRRLAAGRWPKTAGRIETASARHVPHFRSRWSSKEDPCEWTGILTYSYRVNGTSYSGTYNREFTYEAQADDFLRGLVDQPMPVSFNPAKPSESLVFEAEVDALIAAQHPSNDETPPQQTIVSPLMGWGRILLWMLAIVEGTAGAALLLIFYTYRNAAWQPVEWSRPLGKGAWAAAIISLVVWQVVQVRAGSAGYFWKTALAECRR